MTPEQVMKACQVGCTNLIDANDLLAQCYGTIGKLLIDLQAAQSEPAQAEPVAEDSRVFAGHAVIFTGEDSIVSVFSTKEAAEGDLRTWELAYGSAFKVEPVTLVEAAPQQEQK